MEKQLKHTSKFISLVLRHKPEEIDLQLDANGWAPVQELIIKMNAAGVPIDADLLHTIVDSNDKNRFAFNADQTMIRASQGHSIEVELNLTPVEPPAILYHGTTEKYLESIFSSGLQKQSRQYLHLSATIEAAKTVGSRHGKPVILSINAKEMYAAGFKFYLSANNVWLADEVPVNYIKLDDK